MGAGQCTTVDGIDVWYPGVPNRPYLIVGRGLETKYRTGVGSLSYIPVRDFKPLAAAAKSNHFDGFIVVGERREIPAAAGQPRSYQLLLQGIRYR
jgi:hypothetical protein